MRKFYVAFISLFIIFGNARATIESDVALDFLSTIVSGQCEFLITYNEPYSAINSDCNLFRMNGQQVVEQNNAPISGFNIGYPRSQSVPAYFTWPTVDNSPQASANYCQEFGDESNLIVLGHHSDSDQNSSWPGAAQCGNTPSSQQPVITFGITGFLGCPPGCQTSPYLIEWAGAYATSYEVERKVAALWISHYSGSGTSTAGSSNGTYSPGQYRIRAVNGAGSSPWDYVWLSVQCSSTQNPW